MKKITNTFIWSGGSCAAAGFLFACVNEQQWIKQVNKNVGLNEPQYVQVQVSNSHHALGLGLFILSAALFICAGLLMHRYGYEPAQKPASTAPAGAIVADAAVAENNSVTASTANEDTQQ